MAAIKECSSDSVEDWLKSIGMSKYLSNFASLNIRYPYLKHLTIHDLQNDLKVQDPKDAFLILEQIKMSRAIKFCLKSSCIQNDFPVRYDDTLIGSDKRCDIIVDSTDSVQCIIKYIQFDKSFYVSSIGKGKCYFKLPLQKPLEQGMSFNICGSDFFVKKILYSYFGKPIFCSIVKDGKENFDFGSEGIYIGKSLQCRIRIEYGVHNIDAHINGDFVLENYSDGLEELREGIMYAFQVGDVLNVDGVDIMFQ